MSDSLAYLEVDESVAIVTMNRPEKLNAISRELKAALVSAVRDGKMNIEDACRYYMLSTEEFAAWERAIEAYGVAGLRVTRLQVYRDAPPTRLAKPR